MPPTISLSIKTDVADSLSPGNLCKHAKVQRDEVWERERGGGGGGGTGLALLKASICGSSRGNCLLLFQAITTLVFLNTMQSAFYKTF